MGTDFSGELVRVYSTQSLTDGYLARGRLEAEGIPVVLNRTTRWSGWRRQRSSLRARSAMMFFWTSVGPAPIVVYRCHT